MWPGGDRNCLRKALVLWFRLRRLHLDPKLRTGVKRHRDGLAFHAWIELDGYILNDDPREICKYTQLPTDEIGKFVKAR